MLDTHQSFMRARQSIWGPRLTLAAILAVGLGIRLAYLRSAVRAPGFHWDDPDGYLGNALLLARPDGWHWSFDVAKYVVGSKLFALPPLYSIFLSILALFPGLPVSALVAHAVLATIATALVFTIGRSLHSTATGLAASAAYALSVPTILNVYSTSQEALYIPLVLLAFALYARALTRDAGPLAFGAAGAALGLAALTRSMPLFFVVPFAALHVAAAPDRRVALRQSVGCLAGFALVVVPYCVGLSRAFGQVTLIDSHSGLSGVNAGSSELPTPGLGSTAEALWRVMTANPVAFLEDCLGRARTLLYVNGGRLLQIYIVAGSRAMAIAWKIFVHVGTDALLIAAVILAWPGAVLCRNTRLALAFLMWAGLNIAIASAGGFGGARLRAPFEPLLLLLAAVVLTGGWRPRPRMAIAFAVALGIMMSIIVIPQLPRSFRSWPDYGVQWPSVLNRTVGGIRGRAGFNVPAYDGVATFAVEPVGARPVQVGVRAGGVTVESVRLNRERRTIAWLWPRRGFAFAELDAVDAETRAPAAVRVHVGPR